MRNIRLISKIFAFALVFIALWSCDNYETYGDKKEKERDAINEYIKSRNIKEITEDEFVLKGCTTDTTAHEYVYLSKSGI